METGDIPLPDGFDDEDLPDISFDSVGEGASNIAAAALKSLEDPSLQPELAELDAASTPPQPSDQYSTHGDIHQAATSDDGVRPIRFEIIFPRLSEEARSQYQDVQSDVVDFIIEEITNDPGGENDGSIFRLEYTDGREDYMSLADLLDYPGGRRALRQFQMSRSPSSQHSYPNRNKRESQNWDDFEDDSRSESDLSDDLTAYDDDGDDIPARASKRRRLSRGRSTRQTSHARVGEADKGEVSRTVPNQSHIRQLRERRPRQLTLTDMGLVNGSGSGYEEDELAQDSFLASDNDEFTLVTSDIQPTRGRPRKNMRARSSRLARKPEPRSRGSSIEFEDGNRRRSGRSTRNVKSMRDTTALDDDDEEFYIVDTKEPAVPKVISVKEVFQPLPPDSDFPLFHTTVCETCGQGPVSAKGQLIGCQGCSLTFHKVCLGYRSKREHLATKVGEDSFVLQCRWCVCIHLKKDKNAPRYNMCQSCKGNGPSCTAFSTKKTANQEEKLRAENDGVDPITPVDASLINNPQHVLFRCTRCKRGWHFEHLPPLSGPQSIPDSGTSPSDIREQRLAEYSGNWNCRDCATNEKVQALVAWRPASKVIEPNQTYDDFREDDREFLVKWQDRSYFHCSWMPGAWVYGVVATTSRMTFAKRDAIESQLKLNEKDAIPEEYLLTDVILLVKMDKSISSSRKEKSKEADLARISQVKQVYVKFQGLGYQEAVWDSPPSPDSGRIYDTFKAAYEEYLCGKYFPHDSYDKMRERVRAYRNGPFEDLKAQPAGIKRGKLMEYQMEGVSWILYNYHQSRNVILADEMGLGKTVQVVTLLTTLIQDKPKCWPFMVVVPNSTCPNWRREIKYWAPDLRVVTYHGGRRPQELAYKYELFPDGSSQMKAHIVVMSYDSAQDERTKSLFSSVHWAGLVVDEGQRLKNDRNLLYTALKSMRFPFRLLLTGTPLQNNKRELFNLLQFVDPQHDAAKLDEQYSELNATNLPELHEKIRPYFLRRTKAQVLKFLPPMAQIILPVSMSILQEKLCKSIMAKSPELIKAIFANKKIRSKERGSLNNILVQLRKCLCHPFLYSEAIEEKSTDPETMHRNLVAASSKLVLLEIMLPKLKERGHRVLIFSQFLGQLDIMEDFLNGMGLEHRRLDGSISSLEKQKRIDDFNAPDSPIFAFLLSTRAGGVGINLATADTVIILDPDFNPHQDIQALSRAHRIGQKKKVLCFQLMTKNSPEEKIMAIGRSKMALDHVLIESMDNEADAGDDLEDILKFGASALFSDEQDQKDVLRYDDASVDKLLDRSGMEQTKTDDGTAESQFSFARVWANDKGSFDEQLAEHQDPTLEPSIWERILAEREAEARRIAEENEVTLGRGGRRRRAVNYRTTEPADGADPSGSEESGDFDTDADQDERDDEDEEFMSELDVPATVAIDKSKPKETRPLTNDTANHETSPRGHPPGVKNATTNGTKALQPFVFENPGNKPEYLQARFPNSSQGGRSPVTYTTTPGLAGHGSGPHSSAQSGPFRNYPGATVPGPMPHSGPMGFRHVTPLPMAPGQQGHSGLRAPQVHHYTQHHATGHPQVRSLAPKGGASVGRGADHPSNTTVPGFQPLSEATLAIIRGQTNANLSSPRAANARSPRAGDPGGQSDPSCPICNKGGHLPSECKVPTTEAQLRVALDAIASWPSSPVKSAEKVLLKAKLKARSILGSQADGPGRV